MPRWMAGEAVILLKSPVAAATPLRVEFTIHPQAPARRDNIAGRWSEGRGADVCGTLGRIHWKLRLFTAARNRPPR